MPKGKRKADPVDGENIVPNTSEPCQSDAPSPLLQLAVKASPSTSREDLNNVAEIHSLSDKSSAFQVELPDVESKPSTLSPNSSFHENRNFSIFISSCGSKGGNGDASPLSGLPSAGDCLMKGPLMKCLRPESPSPSKRMRMHSKTETVDKSTASPPDASCQRGQNADDTRPALPTETGKAERKQDAERDKHNGTEGIKANTATSPKEKMDDCEKSPESPMITGFATVTNHNGESTVHGLLPSVIPSNSGNLSPCLSAEGNWYQIVPTALPPISGENTSTTLSSLLSIAATSTMSTTSTTATVSGDPLFGFLQQFTSSASDVLRLPVNMSTPTPHFLYASHPRSGQLLLVSPVGDLGGVQPLAQEQQQQQQVSQQQQQQHMQYLQLQPQQQQPEPQLGRWKSPQKVSQQNTGMAFSHVLPGKLKGSIVNQLLQTKFPSSLEKGSNDQENNPPVTAAQELLALASPARTKKSLHATIPPPLYQSSPRGSDDEPVRENHNMKERRRRARIKEACDLMRELVPGMSDKTDKATVFEFSARYIHFLKNFVGAHHDKDFLIKYSPY